ncbi:transposable element Tcb1 transposase [Trichonephila clavipes]|nr:transposable element Tcb1 transposase [Trichonephila clavipes]
MAANDCTASSRQLVASWSNASGVLMSASSILRRLLHRELRARVPLYRISFTANHRRLRLQRAHEHRVWQADWHQVIFSDESRFNLWNHDVRNRVKRYSGERCLTKCVIERHGGLTPEVMVWRRFRIMDDPTGYELRGLRMIVIGIFILELHPAHWWSRGFLSVSKVAGVMTKDKKLQYFKGLVPAHKAKMTQWWLKENVPYFSEHKDWSSSSLNLNPLDYKLWVVLEAKVCLKRHHNLKCLKSSWRKAAMEFPMEVVRASIAD